MSSNLNFIYKLSFLSGFLSLAIEIFWLRTLSFATLSSPSSTAFTLSIFLLGIAVGAMLGRKICAEAKVGITSIGKIYLLSGFVDLAIFSAALQLADHGAFVLFTGIFIFLSSAVRGMVFPIIHHIGADKKKTGREISNVYFSNVAGATLAPILIGFVLLDYLSTQQVYLAICALTLLVATLCFKSAQMGALSLLLGLATATYAVLVPEKLITTIASNSYEPNTKPEFIIENKQSIVTGYRNKEPGMENDILIYGNNAYDGRLNTDIFADTNAVSRGYMLAAAHPSLNDVLVIGLSAGAWTKALSLNPDIKSITVVEINPAYIEVIKRDPALSTLLKDKRIKIIIDDGRKWMAKNSHRKFDLVVMNTSFHWRAYATNLVSVEFSRLTNQILKPGGWAYFNATGSTDIYATAQKSFKYAYQHRNMVLASNAPISIDRKAIEDKLCKMRDPWTSEKTFKTDFECRLASYAATKHSVLGYSNKSDLLNAGFGDYQIVTDDNMIIEHQKTFDLINYDLIK